MGKSKQAFIISIFVFAALVFGVRLYALHAQTAQPDVCKNPTSQDIIDACAQYSQESAKLLDLQNQLAAQKQKSGSLQKNVNSLLSQITIAQNKIKAEITTISNLSIQITQKQKAITDLSGELDREHSSMAQLLKKTDELDQQGATYVLFSADSVSTFFKDLDDFLSVKQSLYASLNKVKLIKSATETQKADLQDKQSQALDAKNALQSQKNEIQASETQVQQLLSQSKTAEQQQQTLVAQQQQKVAQIQSRLFTFAGGTKSIPFSEAYQDAVAAQAKTNVRPAFVLAILTQESNLGKNVGTCNRAGDPPSKSYLNVMSPTRDIPAFLRITAALGLDPTTTPVSCPIAGGGWGGGMGPAQFIPSTWELIQSRVASALGIPAANPWRAADAIMASSIYLSDRGAIAGDETSERNAACRYYSGRSCDGKKPANSFYGNSVMSIARSIQSDIDYLNQYGVSRR